jgi:hypothetical protein
MTKQKNDNFVIARNGQRYKYSNYTEEQLKKLNKNTIKDLYTGLHFNHEELKAEKKKRNYKNNQRRMKKHPEKYVEYAKRSEEKYGRKKTAKEKPENETLPDSPIYIESPMYAPVSTTDMMMCNNELILKRSDKLNISYLIDNNEDDDEEEEKDNNSSILNELDEDKTIMYFKNEHHLYDGTVSL